MQPRLTKVHGSSTEKLKLPAKSSSGPLLCGCGSRASSRALVDSNPPRAGAKSVATFEVALTLCRGIPRVGARGDLVEPLRPGVKIANLPGLGYLPGDIVTDHGRQQAGASEQLSGIDSGVVTH